MTKSPVVLVHGFLSTATMLWPLKRRLERAGHQVFLTDLSPLAIQDVRELAQQLDENVERTRAETGAERVDLVGVSQGGIISLWWLHHLGGWEKVHRFVTVGAPVRGTWAAALGIPLFGAISRGVWQMLPGTNLVFELTAAGLPDGADVVTLSLAGDPVCPPERCHLEGADNRVVAGPPGPLKHQWLVFSRLIAGELLAALR